MNNDTPKSKPRTRPFLCGGEKLTQDREPKLLLAALFFGTLLSAAAVILYLLFAYASLSAGSQENNWLLGVFSDFAYIMDVSLKHSPYVAENSSYPPLAIAVLYPFALICKGTLEKYAHIELSADELTAKLLVDGSFWLSLVLFVAICTAAIVTVSIKLYGHGRLNTLTLGLITILGAPFVFTAMRGNTIYFALIFTLLFLLFYNNERACLRELGYLCLVIAGLIKIYPLFFGVFLLHEKRFLAAARVAAYSVLGFFLSFYLFGGAYDISPFFSNLASFASDKARLAAQNNLSLSSFCGKVIALLFPNAESGVVDTVIAVFVLTAFILATVTATATRSNFSRSVIAAGVVILVPTVSYFYTLIFTIIPFGYLLCKRDSLSRRARTIYFVIFGFLFFTPALLFQNYLLHTLCVTALATTECIRVIKEKV